MARKGGQIFQIDHANGAAADFIFVSRADAALGGANAKQAAVRLALGIELAMQRQYQRGIFRHHQILGRDGDAQTFEPPDFVDERPRIHHHAIADDGKLARPDHAGRQQAQFVGDAVYHQRVAGIVAALEAHHHVGSRRQPVDDLALAFVAPLGADHRDIGHYSVPG